MCFSPQADLVGGLVIGAIGVSVARNVHRRRDHLAFAALPLLFAVHQLTETFVWWGLQGHVPSRVGVIATWLYLLFAFVVLPVYLPLAIRALEPPGRRRTLMSGFVALGAVVSSLLLAAMIRGPVSASLGHAGVRVKRLIFGSFVASAVLAGVAGILVSSRVGSGDFTVGSPYLFPAAAAIFLGSTQVKPRVFNVWGTILAVYALGSIVKGLELGGAPFWLSDFMNGVALLSAVAIGGARSWAWPRRLLRLRTQRSENTA
jgi:hypothetical protein